MFAVLISLTACAKNAPVPKASMLPKARIAKPAVDPATGTWASPRVIATGRPIPKGGNYKLGKPYKISGKWYVPKLDPAYDRAGIASWYGDKFHGRKTANGEIYDMNALTAAHTTMPLPSYAYVTNLTNGRTIMVRVNDRGPYAHNRIIDMSKAAARALNYKGKGLTKVRVRYAGPAPLGGSVQREQAYLARQPWYQSQGHLAATPRRQTPRRIARAPSLEHITPAAIGAGRRPTWTWQPSAPSRVQPSYSSQQRSSGQWQAESLPQANGLGAYRDHRGSGGAGRRQVATWERLNLAGRTQTMPRSWPSQPRSQPMPQNQNRQRQRHQHRHEPATRADDRHRQSAQVYVRAGTFANRGNAERLRDRLLALGPVQLQTVPLGGLTGYRVSVGPVAAASGPQLLTKVALIGGTNPILVAQ